MDKEPTYIIFHASLIKCLEEERITQGELVTATGYSNSYISQIITRKRYASFEAQIKIADACGYRYVDFINDRKAPHVKDGHDLLKKLTLENVEMENRIELYKDLIEMKDMNIALMNEKIAMLKQQLQLQNGGSAGTALGEEKDTKDSSG